MSDLSRCCAEVFTTQPIVHRLKQADATTGPAVKTKKPMIHGEIYASPIRTRRLSTLGRLRIEPTVSKVRRYSTQQK